MDKIQIVNLKGDFSISLKDNQKAIIYQALDSAIDNIKIEMGKNSQLELLTFNRGLVKKASLSAKLQENANLSIFNMVSSDEDFDINQQIYLDQPNATTNILNVCLGYNQAKINSLIHIFHNNEYTNSDLETYAIALEKSTLILNNNATIKKGCKKAVAHQKAKGLNLSSASTIKAQPNLYIDEFDVIASHSASVGNVNKDDLFYLMSRGLTEAEARKIVVMGFIHPLLDKITTDVNPEVEKIKQGILEEFSERLK